MRIALPARRDSIEAARTSVLEHLSAGTLPPALVYRIELVLEEVLMNIIWHAYDDSGEGEIVVEAERMPGGVKLVFEDTGPPFDPREAPAYEAPRTLAEAHVGGLGLVLLRKFAREISYERQGGTNRLALTLTANDIKANRP